MNLHIRCKNYRVHKPVNLHCKDIVRFIVYPLKVVTGSLHFLRFSKLWLFELPPKQTNKSRLVNTQQRQGSRLTSSSSYVLLLMLRTLRVTWTAVRRRHTSRVRQTFQLTSLPEGSRGGYDVPQIPNHNGIRQRKWTFREVRWRTYR